MGGERRTTTQKADPWSGAQPYMKEALGDASGLYEQGGLAASPYQGDISGGFGPASGLSQMMTMSRAMDGAPGIDMANNTVMGMMDQGYQSDRLDAVKNNALSSAIPAAVSQFSGSGMTNSTQAMDTVGRAASDAVAPYEYNAYNTMQDRAMGAAGMAPQMYQAGFLPAQMMGQVGSQQDAMAQAIQQANQQRYMQAQQQPIDNLMNYANLAMGMGGQGGSSTQTAENNPGMMNTLGSMMMGAGMLFSDRRLKRDIRRIGKTPGGHNWYAFKYLWSDAPQEGVMADEVPHAVAGHVGGFAVVDYARVS